MRGKDGAEASRMYYKRNGWRDHGQARFFGSPEALIVAVGGTLARKVGLKKLRAQAGQGGAGRKPPERRRLLRRGEAMERRLPERRRAAASRVLPSRNFKLHAREIISRPPAVAGAMECELSGRK